LRFGWLYFAGKILRNVSAMSNRRLVVSGIAMTVHDKCSDSTLDRVIENTPAVMLERLVWRRLTMRFQDVRLNQTARSVAAQLGQFKARKSIYLTAFLMALGAAAPAFAANPEHVQQLLQTRECMRCDLSGADLSNAHLIGADLREANLVGANLQGSNLEGADLTGANLSNTVLVGTFLTNASLNQSNLANANMTNAIAFNADTRGANMMNLTIVNAQIFGSGISIGGPAEDIPEEQMP
jgi:uncharacterized protein YjbI with pentapeptide repeats